MKTLIVHIGAGKTGTSSIQASLKENSKLLKQHRIKYSGMLFEYSQRLHYWQHPNFSEDILKFPVEKLKQELLEIMRKELVEDESVDTLVWSNEWLFGRHNFFIPALSALEGLGCDVKIICYLREHGSWSKSAYVQWGIKHKTYSGEIKTYREYFDARPVCFMAAVKPWIDAFGRNVELKNYEYRGDVVSDFFKGLGINNEISSSRINEQLGAEELLTRAVFNNLIDSDAHPSDFLKAFDRDDFKDIQGAESWLNSCLPNSEDIDWLRDQTSQDLNQINQLLQSMGEPHLEYRNVTLKEFKINHLVMI